MGRGGAREHDREGGGAGARHSARDRRIHVLEPVVDERSADAPRGCDADGGGVDNGMGDRIGALPDLVDHATDGGAVGQAEEHRVRDGRDVRNGVPGTRPFRGALRRTRRVVDAEPMAGRGEVLRHGPAHVAETDESYGGHDGASLSHVAELVQTLAGPVSPRFENVRRCPRRKCPCGADPCGPPSSLPADPSLGSRGPDLYHGTAASSV